MINYKILNPKFFKKYAEYVSHMIDDGVIEFGGGIKMIGMDASRICFFEVSLGLDFVEIINDEKRKACICMSDFIKILGRFSEAKTLNILFDTNLRQFKIKGKINNKTKTFTLREIDSEIENIPFEKLLAIPYRAIFKMEGSDLDEFVKDADIYSEILTFNTKGFKLNFKSSGVTGECNIEVETEQEIYSEEVGSYSNSFLKDIVKALKGSEIWVMFNTDFPLCLYDKVSEETYVRIYLAPRVDDEDDDI